MTTSTFDTHASFKALTAAGFSEAQAEAIIESQQRALDQGGLATKADINEVRLEIAQAKADIIKRVVSAGVLQIAIIAALVMALVKTA